MNLGITLDKAIEIISLYFDQFPGIKVYVENSHKMSLDNYFVLNEFGQRKYTYGSNPIFQGTAAYNASLRLAQNVRVQSTASTFGLMCFARLNQSIKKIGGKCICTVYDSIEMEIPIPRAAEALELTYYHLDDEPVNIYDWLKLPVGVDAEIGFNWGKAKHIHRGATQTEIEQLLSTMR